MKAILVKVDVAADKLGEPVSVLFDLASGGTLTERGLQWVWNFSNPIDSYRRDLRFWVPELDARAEGDGRYDGWQIDAVLNAILPEHRQHFHAGELDQILQLRPRTRIDFGAELNGDLKQGRHFYSRHDVFWFLKRRWLGAFSFPATTPASPRATAAIQADTSKATLHAAQTLP